MGYVDVLKEFHKNVSVNLQKEECIVETPILYFFKVILPKKLQTNFYGIAAFSCSLPLDWNKNALIEDTKEPFFYEVALLSSDNTIIYNDDLGYCTYELPVFESSEEVIKEIQRVIQIINKTINYS